MKALGAYIFAGGFTLGVREHFDVVAHLEDSRYGVRSSLRANPGLEVYDDEQYWPLDRYRDEIDFVYCNPPCAPFSQAGATMRGGGDAWKTDPRLKCWQNCFVVLEAVRPMVFAVESVVRARTAAKSFVSQLVDLVHHQGYAVTHVLVDAKNHGMAQRRKRYFFVAHRVPLLLEEPDEPTPTVYDLIETIEDLGYVPEWNDPTHEALVPFLPTNASFRSMWEEMYDVEDRERNAQGGVKGRPRIFIHRVRGDVIGTITGDYFVHPSLDRFLSISEIKVLNGFPEDYWLEGKPAYQFSLISRGVCPPVAEWLARHVARSIETGGRVDTWSEDQVDFR